MEGLFFSVNQVWFIYPINYGYLLMSIIFIIGISCYVKLKKNNKAIESYISNINYVYINPKDVNYNQKTLHSIKDYISKKYLPKHTWAHTNIEIKSYIKNEKLLKLIKTLERIEYSGEKTTVEENEKNNSQLALLLQ